MEIGAKVLIVKTRRRGFSMRPGRVTYVSDTARFVVVDLGLYRETFYMDYCPENNYRVKEVADEETDQWRKSINQRNYYELPVILGEAG
jgi:hypothetical protein